MKKTNSGNKAELRTSANSSIKVLSSILFLISTVLIYSCGASHEKYAEDRATLADSVSSPISSTAAKVSKADSGHTFIRTADIKFKVKDVKKATFQIEDVVAKHGGFVTYTNLSGNVSYSTRTEISEDSLMESTHYEVDNSITLRVPNTQLDSTLREIAPLMEFLDHRTIKADDIKFTLMTNQLAENRYTHHKERFTGAIDNRGKKLRETAEAEDELLFKQESADNTRIETLDLLDRIAYSTVTLYIYQPETIAFTRIAKEDNIIPYKPTFLKRLRESVKDGWLIFEDIILFFVQMWGLIVLVIGVFLLVKWMVAYFSKANLKKA